MPCDQAACDWGKNSGYARVSPLRQIVSSKTELAKKLEELERKYDRQFKVVFEAIRQLTTSPERSRSGLRQRQLRSND